VGLTKRDGQVPALDDINPTARMFRRAARRASGKTTCSVIARLDRPAAERRDTCRGATRAARMSH